MKDKIFLDTEVFQNIQFNYENKKLELLLNLQKINVLELNIISVIDNEVKQRINKKFDGLRTLLKKNKEMFYILNNIEELKNKIDYRKIEEYRKYVTSQYEDFRNKNLNVIYHNTIDLDEIMNLYFSELPPFNKELKKQELPDALSVAMIKQEIKGKPITIVSNDNDITELVDSLKLQENIIVYKDIEKLLDKYNRENEFYDRFIEIIKEKDFHNQIEEGFDLLDINVYGYLDPTIQRKKYMGYDGIKDVNILELEEDYLYFSFVVPFNIELEIETTDPEGWVYDSEEKDVYYFGKKEYAIEKKIDIKYEATMNNENGEWIVTDITPELFYEFEFDPYEYY